MMRWRYGLAVALAATVGACQPGTDQASDSGAAAEPGPPTLIEIMQGLEVDMERVAHGVWVADFDSIAAGARAVADHPQVGADERARIAEVLGAGMAGFRQADLAVHDTAVALEARARSRDMPGVLTTLTGLQEGCVACHTGYRDTLRAARQ